MSENKSETLLHEIKYVPVNDKNVQELKPEKELKRPDTLYLIFSVISGLFLIMAGGSSLVWSSPALVKLKSNDTEVNPLGRPITTIEISTLIGSPFFAALLGSLFLTSLADKIGRKKSLQILALGMVLSEIGLSFSTTIPLMATCGSLFGISFSGTLGILAIYLTEICEDHNRAKYGCFMSGFIPLGQLFAYIIGPLFNLRNFTLLLGVPIILFLIFFCFAPESPMYSISNGRKEECIKTLKKLRSNKTNNEIDNDYFKISQSISGSKNQTKSNFFTVLKSKEGRIGILLGMLPILGQYFCGIPIIMPLMAPIFNEAGISLSGNTVAVIVGSFKVSCYVFTSLLIEKTGRRSMLLLSSAGASIPISALGVFFYLKHIDSPLITRIQWLPVVAVLSFIFFYSLGLGPLPFAIMSELFPTDVRTSAVSFIITVAGIALSTYIFIFPLYEEMVGMHWCLWIFGMTCFGTALLIYFFFPETKGKSIHEIQEMLKNY